MRAVADRDGSNAGIGRHFKIVGGVADHQRGLRAHCKFVHQFVQHVRRRLGRAAVGAAHRCEMPRNAGCRHGTLQALGAFPRGDAQQMATIRQI